MSSSGAARRRPNTTRSSPGIDWPRSRDATSGRANRSPSRAASRRDPGMTTRELVTGRRRSSPPTWRCSPAGGRRTTRPSRRPTHWPPRPGPTRRRPRSRSPSRPSTPERPTTSRGRGRPPRRSRRRLIPGNSPPAAARSPPVPPPLFAGCGRQPATRDPCAGQCTKNSRIDVTCELSEALPRKPRCQFSSIVRSSE